LVRNSDFSLLFQGARLNVGIGSTTWQTRGFCTFSAMPRAYNKVLHNISSFHSVVRRKPNSKRQESVETMGLILKLAEILVSQNVCSAPEEAEVMAEVVLEVDVDAEIDDVGDTLFSMQRVLVNNLIDNLGIEEAEAQMIFLQLKRSDGYISGDDEESRDSEGENDADESSALVVCDDGDGESDGEYLDEGECELCDRFIKLTRHHLIPKSTWPRVQTKLLQAANAEESGDRKRALLILGHGLEYLLGDENDSRSCVECKSKLSTDKAFVRAILHDTCDICRQCHTTVHRTHTNMELALNYNSVDKLLEDDRIAKFCKWASKQKTGKYKRC
jgi:hypothetical protein